MKQGTIIKESLIDDDVLELVDIKDAAILRADNHIPSQPLYWTAIAFETKRAVKDEIFLERLKGSLRDDWYVDLHDDVEKILVFKGKILRYQKGDMIGKLEAVNYCRQMGIPETQIDWSE